MRRPVFEPLILSVSLVLVTGCLGDPPPAADMQFLLSNALADDIEVIEVTVIDGGNCDGPDVVGGTPLSDIDPIVVGPQATQSLELSEGTRAFSALALDSADESSAIQLARGCSREVLVAGETYNITIELVEF